MSQQLTNVSIIASYLLGLFAPQNLFFFHYLYIFFFLMFKYVGLSLSRGYLDYCNLRCPDFSPLIYWTRFDYFFFLRRFFDWRWWLTCCQLFSCFVVKWVDSIEGCSPSISFIIFSSHFCCCCGYLVDYRSFHNYAFCRSHDDHYKF